MSPLVFTPDAACALGGPSWLVARRVAAAESFATAELPTDSEEVWRYSRIADLDLERYSPPAEPGVTAGDLQPLVPEVAATVTVVDGFLVRCDLSAELRAAGVYVGPLAEAPNAQALGTEHGRTTDVFATMNDAFTREPIAVVVPKGISVALPILVEHIVTRPGAAVFPRLVVHASEAAAVRVVERFTSGDRAALVVPLVELVASANAQVGYLGVQQLGASTWQLGSVVAVVEQSATVTASAAALGGEYARTRTDCRLVGRGATGNLSALYFGDGEQMHDFRTFQDHAAPDTTSNLLFTGVLDDKSASVYTGLIRVRKNARGSNALQTNRNIKLSDDAFAESVPNLEIENNEVSCKHESYVSPIDTDQRFYLESRGVPPHVAERLVVAGFFAEVLSTLAVGEARTTLADAVAAKIDAHEFAP